MQLLRHFNSIKGNNTRRATKYSFATFKWVWFISAWLCLYGFWEFLLAQRHNCSRVVNFKNWRLNSVFHPWIFKQSHILSLFCKVPFLIINACSFEQINRIYEISMHLKKRYFSGTSSNMKIFCYEYLWTHQNWWILNLLIEIVEGLLFFLLLSFWKRSRNSLQIGSSSVHKSGQNVYLKFFWVKKICF